MRDDIKGWKTKKVNAVEVSCYFFKTIPRPGGFNLDETELELRNGSAFRTLDSNNFERKACVAADFKEPDDEEPDDRSKEDELCFDDGCGRGCPISASTFRLFASWSAVNARLAL